MTNFPFSQFGVTNPFGQDQSDQMAYVMEMSQWVERFREDIEAKLLEVQVPTKTVASSTRIHLSRITEVNHFPDPESPPTYKAKSIDTWDAVAEGRITVPQDSSVPPPPAFGNFDNPATDFDPAWVTPLTRPVTSPPFGLEDADITGGPASVGELCFIVIDQTIPVPPPGGGDPPPVQLLFGLMLWEEAKTTLCPSDPSGGGPPPLPSMDGPGTVGELIRDVMDEQRRSWP